MTVSVAEGLIVDAAVATILSRLDSIFARQRMALEALFSGRDVFALIPTGSVEFNTTVHCNSLRLASSTKRMP